MYLKGLIYRELGEGMTEKELASAIRIPLRTLVNILADKDPTDPAIWEKFAQYFRMDVDFLQTGESAHTKTMIAFPGSSSRSPAGHMRKIPFLSWQQLGQIATSKDLPGVIHAEAMLETTDIAGTRTFAVKVPDDAMAPLFSKGEMIFVDPDLEWQPEDYVLAHHPEGHPETLLLRQVKRIGSLCILHPLNRKYDDLPVTNRDDVWGRVVRIRKDL
ncbi:MAG: LexA family transcriptional regulator [Nitrospirota bacterium]